jgi:HemY protein
MVRVFVFFAVIMVAALGFAWLADRPGDVTVVWNGLNIQTSLMVALLGVVLAVGVLMFIWSLLRTVLRAPDLISLFLRNRRGKKGYQAISRGLVAVGAGDMHAARRHAREAHRLAPQEPLTHLLSAQTAQLAGDRTGAEKAFAALARREDTKLLGLRGLFIEAQRRDEKAAARGYAEEAAKLTPSPGWAGKAVLDMRCAAGDWAGALSALERNMRAGLIERSLYRRQRAVLLTAQALAARENESETAKTLITEAVGLAPTLVPAVAFAARRLADAGDIRKAARMIEKAWRAGPHPELAESYVNLRLGDAARDRLERAQTLAKKASGNVEGALMVARAARNAQDFSLARQKLSPHLARPTQRVALLMAEIEAAEHGDEGRAREWIARAVHAARDPAWTADGYVSDRWLPVSPLTARIDAFTWRVPLEEMNGPVLAPFDPATQRMIPLAAALAETSPAGPKVVEPRGPDGVAPERPAAAAHAAARTETGFQEKAGENGETTREETVMGAAAPTDGIRASRQPRVAPTHAVEPVIPLVHAPDDPGPDTDTSPDPEPGQWRGV